MNKVIFLDRDGTINLDTNYVNKIDDITILKNVVQGLKILKKAGFKLIIVTNQSGVARGYIKINTLKMINKTIYEQLKNKGVKIDAIYFCPHRKNAQIKKYRKDCYCRKPSPGLLLKAMEDFKIDINSSYMVGDSMTDIYAGYNAGLEKNILLKTGCGSIELDSKDRWEHSPNYIADDLIDAANWIIKDLKKVKGEKNYDNFKIIF